MMRAVVVMGVAGSGKTTIAQGLAAALGWRLLEGDVFHPPENVAKMAAGTPLSDEDRWPWLRAIAAETDRLGALGVRAVIACSALRRAYRDILIGDRADVGLVYLRGDKALIGARLAARTGHFMPAALLDSQFATLEEPGPAERAIIVSVAGPPASIVATIRAAIPTPGAERSN
jgi:carbohydrate kinase (thermoresistant glucokinase family)